MKRASIPFVVSSLLVLGAFTSAAAQGNAVRFQGRVLWIAGQTMIVAIDDGPSVSIDLTRAPQSDYQALGQNDWVVVDAELVRGSRRLSATSVQRSSRRYPESP